MATVAATPEAYVEALSGWQRQCVDRLRVAVRAAALALTLTEQIKWGHLVYACNGPVLLIRAEPERVLFGFWRGQRLRHIEPRLKPGGKYEMATMTFDAQTTLSPEAVARLVADAVALNREHGDPTTVSRPAH